MTEARPTKDLSESPTQTTDHDPDFMLSLARGLAVIRAFDVEEGPLSIAAIARLAGISRSSVGRCLYTLESLGYVVGRDRRYELTPRVLELGHASGESTPLPLVAQPVLDRLREELHQSTSIATLDNSQVVKIGCSFTQRLVSVGLPVGQRSPFYCTALGRALVAWRKDEERSRLFSSVAFVKYTPHTVVDRRTLFLELARVRSQGFSLVSDELELGVSAVAVPVRRFDGTVVAAISAVFPTPGSDEKRIATRIVPVLQAAATEIERALR